jgi:prepilin-type N-terminal cleavage/methylation domain-containing protein
VLTRRGFTIAELVLAIGLLGIIAVVVIGLFVRFTISSTKSSDHTVASELATKLLDDYVDSDPAFWDVHANQELRSHDTETSTTFTYQLDYKLLSGSDAEMGDLYRLDVFVSWWPDGGEGKRNQRRDYGQLHLNLSRIVFVERLK